MIKFNVRSYGLLFPILGSFFLLSLVTSCKTYQSNISHADVSLSSIKKGKALAHIYCQSCQQFPDPSLLDSKHWEKGVLPEMGPRLGSTNFGFETYPTDHDQFIGKDFYPSRPLLSLNEWQDILDYYEATSPDSLPPQKRSIAIQTGLPLFTVEIPDIRFMKPAT